MTRPELTKEEREELRRRMDAYKRARMRRDARLERELARHYSERKAAA